MRNRATPTLLLLALVLCYGACKAASYHHLHEFPEEAGFEDDPFLTPQEKPWGPEETRRGDDDLFLLRHSKRVAQTDAGEMKVVRGFGFGAQYSERPMHIGFITMEPKTLFVPHYLDSHLILFVRKGEAKIGLIYKDELVERRLKMGDIYRVPAGSVFYLVNAGEGQRLNIICSIDPEGSLGFGLLKSFSIAGGTYPTSILAGFDTATLAAAYNVTTTEIEDILTRQTQGPIVYISDSHAPNMWKRFLDLKEEDRLKQLKSMASSEQQDSQDDDNVDIDQPPMTAPFLNIVFSFFDNSRSHDVAKEKGGSKTGKSPDSYNIYERRHDFSNAYGWSIAIHGKDYSPLTNSGIGVYLVNLTAGSMMAPHVNPTATEYGIVLRGSGTVQIVYPNGTSAMKAEVREGDVFWVPRYFPFCQIASRTGPFEFFGFTTSAHENRPQFLAGRNSILQTLRGPETAASFGLSEDRMGRFIDAQGESVILPSRSASTPEKTVKEEAEEEVKEASIPPEKTMPVKEASIPPEKMVKENGKFRKVIKNIGNMGMD